MTHGASRILVHIGQYSHMTPLSHWLDPLVDGRCGNNCYHLYIQVDSLYFIHFHSLRVILINILPRTKLRTLNKLKPSLNRILLLYFVPKIAF